MREDKGEGKKEIPILSSSKFSLDFLQDFLTKRFHYFLKEVLLVQKKDLQSIRFPAILFLDHHILLLDRGYFNFLYLGKIMAFLLRLSESTEIKSIFKSF